MCIEIYQQKPAKTQDIIDGKYGTYYREDHFLRNASTTIDSLSSEQTVIDLESGLLSTLLMAQCQFIRNSSDQRMRANR